MTSVNESDWVFRDQFPERLKVYDQMDTYSEAARMLPEVKVGVRYGDDPREAYDLFPGAPGSPLVIFIHGGYWQSLSRERFSFVAPPLLKAGFSVALPSYPLAPSAKLPLIVEAVDRAVDSIIEKLKSLRIACDSWIVSGHSAGGHLALLAALKSRSVPLAGVVAISPICDLQVLRKTSLDKALSITQAEVETLSPMRLAIPTAPVRLFVGAEETTGFLGQSASYKTRMISVGGDCHSEQLTGLNHYTIPLEMLRPKSLLISAFKELADKR